MSKSNITSKVTNIASSLADEATDYSAASRGAKTTRYISTELKRYENNGKITSIAGAVTASPSKRDAIQRRRAAKLSAIASKAKITQQENEITLLKARVAAIEAALA